MGSGVFPLRRQSEEGLKLCQAIVLVEEVINRLEPDILDGFSGGQQFDNAAYDGGSLARLRLTVKILGEEVSL